MGGLAVLGPTRRWVQVIVAVSAAALAVAALGIPLNEGSPPPATADPYSTEEDGPNLSHVVDGDRIVSASQLHDWQAATDEFGTPPGNRPTGSLAAHAYIDRLERELVDVLGREQVDRERFTFTRFDQPRASNVSLDILEGPAEGGIDVASYVPYSGTTPRGGVEAPLVYLGADADVPAVGAADVRGKIVLLDVPPAPLRAGAFESIAYYEHDPNGTVNPQTPYERTWISQIPLVEQMDALARAGAAGFVAVLDLPEEMAEGAYFPYDGQMHGIPGVFVDRETGAKLKRAATPPEAGPEGVPARLELVSRVVDEAPSYNLVASIPGRTNESILLHSHTDGPNSIEDNGPWATIALADYFASVPRDQRPRTIHVVLTDGHFAGGFAGGVGAWRFVEAHREGLLADTVAALSLEHLGALEYVPREGGDFELTGRNEMAGFFVPENQPLVRETIRMVEGEQLARHVVMRPFEPSEQDPTKRVWPGEGMVFHLAGIPTIQFITGPTYLLNAGQPTTDRFTDYDLMRRQVRGFAQLVTNLSHVPADELASRDPTTVGEPTSILPEPARTPPAGPLDPDPSTASPQSEVDS